MREMRMCLAYQMADKEITDMAETETDQTDGRTG